MTKYMATPEEHLGPYPILLGVAIVELELEVLDCRLQFGHSLGASNEAEWGGGREIACEDQ